MHALLFLYSTVIQSYAASSLSGLMHNQMKKDTDYLNSATVCHSDTACIHVIRVLSKDAFSHTSEVEVVLGIVVADVLNHLVQTLHFACGNFAILHILAKEVTEGAAEILMTRVGEERT